MASLNNEMFTPSVHWPKGVDGNLSKGQSLGFWLSPAEVANQLKVSRTTVMRRIIADKLPAQCVVNHNGLKRWRCLLTPAQAKLADTKVLVGQWQEALRSGWLTGKPLSEATVKAHFYGLKQFYKYRRYDFEALSLAVIIPDEVALAISRIKHDVKAKKDHFGIKEKLFYGVLSFHKFLHKKGLVKDETFNFRKVKPKRVYKKAKLKVFIAQLHQCLEELNYDKRFNLVARAFAYTGLRLNEMVRLQIKDIEFNQGRLLVRNGKGCKQRIIGLLPEAIPVLATLAAGGAESDFLLRTKLGRPLSGGAIQQLFYRRCHKLGVKISPHTLRHTFACLLHDLGFSVPLIQKALGHSNIETTMRYLGVQERELVKLMGLGKG